MDHIKTNWIALEYTGLEFKAWLMSETGVEISRLHATCDRVTPPKEQALALIEPWLSQEVVMDVLSCGLLRDTPADFVSVPCAAFDTARLHNCDMKDARVRVHDVRGVKQDKPSDIMFNETTQIAGYLAQNPKFDGVICLLGRTSQWVRISAEEIVSFESYNTHELMELMSERLTKKSIVGQAWSETVFIGAVDDAISKPEKLAARLMQIQNGLLLNGPDYARECILGLLVGAELASARPYWLGQDVVLLGDPDQSRAYMQAMTKQGVMARYGEVKDVALLGLAVARKDIMSLMS